MAAISLRLLSGWLLRVNRCDMGHSRIKCKWLLFQIIITFCYRLLFQTTTNNVIRILVFILMDKCWIIVTLFYFIIFLMWSTKVNTVWSHGVSFYDMTSKHLFRCLYWLILDQLQEMYWFLISSDEVDAVKKSAKTVHIKILDNVRHSDKTVCFSLSDKIMVCQMMIVM